jgi:hypothetical protein
MPDAESRLPRRSIRVLHHSLLQAFGYSLRSVVRVQQRNNAPLFASGCAQKPEIRHRFGAAIIGVPHRGIELEDGSHSASSAYDTVPQVARKYQEKNQKYFYLYQ